MWFLTIDNGWLNKNDCWDKTYSLSKEKGMQKISHARYFCLACLLISKEESDQKCRHVKLRSFQSLWEVISSSSATNFEVYDIVDEIVIFLNDSKQWSVLFLITNLSQYSRWCSLITSITLSHVFFFVSVSIESGNNSQGDTMSHTHTFKATSLYKRQSDKIWTNITSAKSKTNGLFFQLVPQASSFIPTFSFFISLFLSYFNSFFFFSGLVRKREEWFISAIDWCEWKNIK